MAVATPSTKSAEGRPAGARGASKGEHDQGEEREQERERESP